MSPAQGQTHASPNAGPWRTMSDGDDAALSRHGAGGLVRKIAGGLVLLMGLAGLSQAGQVRGAALSSVLCMSFF